MVVGLITEYNPFHNGHLFHLTQSKKITKCKRVVVVMSGNFVQRGEPAILNKHIRTKMALLNGADVVLELPNLFAVSSANLFALGAIDLLNKTNIVDYVCFGSETGDISNLKKISQILANEPSYFKSFLKTELNKGVSYPLARKKALEKFLNLDLDFLNNPNNILGLEYLISLEKTKSNIIPMCIKRVGADFYSLNICDKIASATSIRNFFSKNDISSVKNSIPENCFEIIKDFIPLEVKSINKYTETLNYILRSKDINDIKNIADITEGLQNRIIKNISKGNKKVTDLIEAVKTKRYTYSKIQKSLMHIILDIKKQDQKMLISSGLNQYIRILGFKKESQDLVSKICSVSSVPVITNINRIKGDLTMEGKYILNNEVKSTDIFYLGTNVNLGQEYREPIVVI